MSKKYKQRPSSFIGIYEEYPAYCFDEACIYLLNALENDKDGKIKLHFNNGDGTEKQVVKHYNSISDFYKSLGV